MSVSTYYKQCGNSRGSLALRGPHAADVWTLERDQGTFLVTLSSQPYYWPVLRTGYVARENFMVSMQTFLLFFFLFQGVHLWNTLHMQRPKLPSMPCMAARQCRWVVLWQGQVRIRPALAALWPDWGVEIICALKLIIQEGPGSWVCLTNQRKGWDGTVIPHRHRTLMAAVF